MDQTDLRLKLVELALRHPAAASASPDHGAKAAVEMAVIFEKWVLEPGQREKLGLPKK